MKKVVMLATYFPPAGGVATFRITKFVKFIHRFNWDPIVLTVKEDYYVESKFVIDHSLLKDIPSDLKIYRTDIGAKSWFFKSLLNGLPTRWLKKLFSVIKQIIKSENPDLLFATGDPFFPLLVGPFAKKFFGLKYVVDFRDPWKLAIIDHKPVGLKGRIFQPINNFLEPIVVNSASRIIVVSEKMAEQYREAYPKRKASDFVVIPNGYDPDDYDSVAIKEQEKFTIIYAGKFLSGQSFRNPSYFLESLKLLQERGLNLKFTYVGEKNPEIEKMVDEIGVVDMFESVGRKSYTDTISLMKGAGMLLLIGSGQETEQTAKIFDYLGCKRPILALASEKGGIADVVKDIEKISLIENKDPNRIANVIEEYYHTHSNELLERENISEYLRENLTMKLSEVFNEVISEN
jgi:glycosyltransferase involved in cell wall biosynthesis